MGLSLLPYQKEPDSGEAISPEQFLNRAFAMLSQAADSLEGCYRELESEVKRLRAELRARHQDLQDSVVRNEQMRRCLERMFQMLPHGVIVVSEDGLCQSMNAEAQRVLGGGAQNDGVSQLIATISAKVNVLPPEVEHTMSVSSISGPVRFAVRRFFLARANGPGCDTMLLLRELTN